MRSIGSLLCVAGLAFCMACHGSNPGSPDAGEAGPLVLGEVAHDESQPLRDITPLTQLPDDENRRQNEEFRTHYFTSAEGTQPEEDALVQRHSALTTPSMPTPARSFDGMGQGFSGPAGTFSVDSAPPDTVGDVGPNHYVQMVNTSFTIFDKTGKALYGPAATRTLWTGFGGGCSTTNDGDGVVRYDRHADRWVLSQFSVNGGSGPYYECVAISTTADPTGSYYRYAFQYTAFDDYPKMSIWPDAYYFTYDMFNGNTFMGAKVCAHDRAKMLSGQTASMQCFNTTNAWGALLPSDVEGPNLPPTGSPAFIFGLGNAQIGTWKFHVDWTTPQSSTFTGPASLSVPAFSELCATSGDCVPQPGTTQRLDGLGDRLMYRAPYRKFADHDAVVLNHSVASGSGGGIRWYEVRNLGTTPTVYQAGTYAPDSAYRWMGSIAMDSAGDIALGYSISSSSIYPGIRYTGRLVTDPLNTMAQGEATLVNGGGSQLTGLGRWGDYSSMNLDPSDDCTFWYTQEYLTSNGTFNWHTRVGSFKFPSCGGTATDGTPPTTSITFPASGASLSGTVSVTATASDNVGVVRVELYADGTLVGTATTAPYSFSWNTTQLSNGAHVLTTKAYDAAGNVGTSTAVNVTTSNATTGGGVTNPGFEAGTLTGWTTSGSASAVAGGHSGSYAAQVGSTTASRDSALKQTVTLPAGRPMLSFWYKLTCPDTVQYDWATVQVQNTTGGVLTTALQKTCTNNNRWTNVTVDLSTWAGQTVVLSFQSHDDAYPSDPTYVLYDDISITQSVGTVVNGGFETGNGSGWTGTGNPSPAITYTAHSGVYAIQVGSASPTTNSTVTQTVVLPAGKPQLSFWYNMSCPDTVDYDWFRVRLLASNGSVLGTVLPPTCRASGWVNVIADLTSFAGQTVVLSFENHDDDYYADPTYTVIDDVTVTTP